MDQSDRVLKADYAVLGLPETATRDEVIKAYRCLARLYHPDVSSAQDAAQRFEAIEDAYRHALQQIAAHTARPSTNSIEASRNDEGRPNWVDLRRAPGIARPAIVAGPVRIETSSLRTRPVITNSHGEMHG